MAASELNIDKIVQIFRDIVKRKTTYNETNLHYEYYKRAGDTIPYKAHGYESLRDLIQKQANDMFYFEKVGNDLEFIAPKRVDDSTAYSEMNKGVKKMSLVKTIEESGCYSGSNKSKRVRVSNNIYFSQPQSTGVNNPFQNIRNDIKISFDFGLQKREVDRCSSIDSETISEAKSLANDNQQSNSTGDMNSGTYSSARNPSETMDVDTQDGDLPWDQKYWHLKVTHPVSSNEIWDRMRKMTSKLIQTVALNPKRSRIQIGNELYVVRDKQSCYRTIVLKLETEINECKCFMVDIGCVKWCDEEDIFGCPHEFREIPPMAIRFSLYGLIEFKESRGASEIIAMELANKELWAKIKMKPKEFRKQDGKRTPIPAIFYDSVDRYNRVNISADIMEKMVVTFKPPKLSKGRTNYVAVTHVSKVTGNIYGHVISNSTDLKYVNAMIEALVENGVCQCYEHFESETDLHELLAINANKLYLIYSEHDQTWYRATILQLETDVSASKEKNICSRCSVYCFLVDYGNTRVVNLTNVYGLRMGILAQYPHLAIAMTLEGVHMTRDKIDRLKTLLLPGDNVFVDVYQTMDCGDSNRTKTISLAKISKLEKSAINNETYVCEINRLMNGTN
ncbi:uncharacterized protein LOC129569178 isoform X2 [Sitodiplosis mosellana]|uniref:uncharacterized protein LOC129569178 isoform X2 n=1 Tax=Sitodiplosis mosellana TaxID=263140 RepID=UPI00244429AB|nr:uncharacterized protein LOC129569178 isoform X2 [Sitodiplosis mosellana]